MRACNASFFACPWRGPVSGVAQLRSEEEEQAGFACGWHAAKVEMLHAGWLLNTVARTAVQLPGSAPRLGRLLNTVASTAAQHRGWDGCSAPRVSTVCRTAG
eukprot:365215-Chlamydomonas_euryale.AAC.2